MRWHIHIKSLRLMSTLSLVDEKHSEGGPVVALGRCDTFSRHQGSLLSTLHCRWRARLQQQTEVNAKDRSERHKCTNQLQSLRLNQPPFAVKFRVSILPDSSQQTETAEMSSGPNAETLYRPRVAIESLAGIQPDLFRKSLSVAARPANLARDILTARFSLDGRRPWPARPPCR